MEDKLTCHIESNSKAFKKGLLVSMRNMKRRMTHLVLVLMAGVYASASFAAPNIKSWNTDNGVRVLYVHAPEIAMVDLQILFDAGSARDKNKKGLAMLTNRMLSMGAGKLNATGIAERFESIGAQVSRGALRDSAWLSMRTLSNEKYLNKAVKTLALILNKPRFQSAVLVREKKRILSALKQKQQSPSAIAKRAFYKEIFRDHPYANMPIGTASGIKSIKRQDLKRFYKQYYVGRNAVVAIVGAISEQRARELALQLTSKMKSGVKAADLPKVKPLSKSKYVHIPHPSSQSHIYIGQPGNYRGDPDYYSLYVANHPFGGSGLVSRLAEEVREKRGLAYSVYSYFSPMRRKGIFMMGMQTKNSNATKAIALLNKELNKYVSGGMTRKEFKHSTSNITGGFALRIDNNKKIVQYLGLIGFYNLPKTYLTDFNKKVESLSRKEINAAFKRRINPKAMVTVVVGGRTAPTVATQ